MDEFKNHNLNEYLQNISGILTGSVMNASIVLSKILRNFSSIKTEIRAIVPFSFNSEVFDDIVYKTFLEGNYITLCHLACDIKIPGVVQSFHFDCEEQRYVLWGKQREITQIPDCREKLKGLKKLVIEGITYKDNIRVVDNAIIEAEQMGINVDFVLSAPNIIRIYRESLMQQILQKRINTIIGIPTEIMTLLGDKNYLQIQEFSKINKVNILEIGENEIRFIKTDGTEIHLKGKFNFRYKDFFLVGFYVGGRFGLDAEKSLYAGYALTLLNIQIPDIFYAQNSELLKCLTDLIPNRITLLSKGKTEQCVLRH